jgi:hypothetical protein
MKINYKNIDLKIISYNCGYDCGPCKLRSNYNFYWCNLFCRSGKIWIKDIFNSDIFRL